jgi:hypothetical protein
VGTDEGADLNAAADEEIRCARHPNVTTVLRCGRCDTPICPRCLVQTPVGARCPDCAQVRRLPTVDVSPAFLARGLGASIVSGAAVGAAWGYAVGSSRGFVGIFIIFIAMAVGWAIGESIALATNRKRSTTLQACAVLGVVLAYLVHNLVVGGALLPAGDIWGYLATVFAAVVAAQRLQA